MGLILVGAPRKTTVSARAVVVVVDVAAVVVAAAVGTFYTVRIALHGKNTIKKCRVS